MAALAAPVLAVVAIVVAQMCTEWTPVIGVLLAYVSGLLMTFEFRVKAIPEDESSATTDISLREQVQQRADNDEPRNKNQQRNKQH